MLSMHSKDELETFFKNKRFSEPFIDLTKPHSSNGIGAIYIDDDPLIPEHGDYKYIEKCALCTFYDSYHELVPFMQKYDKDIWGILCNNIQNAHDKYKKYHNKNSIHLLCKESIHNQHAYHVRCLSLFVYIYRTKYDSDPQCPLDAKWIELESMTDDNHILSNDDTSYWASDEDIIEYDHINNDYIDQGDNMEVKDAGITGAKKLKHKYKQTYQCCIHIIEVKDLKMPNNSDLIPKPIFSIKSNAFNTAYKCSFEGKASFSKVFDIAYPFQSQMLETDFNDAMIEIAIYSSNSWWIDTLLGKMVLQAKVVNEQANHEYYRKWDILKGNNGFIAGKILYSCVIFSQQDFKLNPYLPVHVYDLEVAMWDEILQNKQEKMNNNDINSLNDLNYLNQSILNEQENGPSIEMHAIEFTIIQAQFLAKRNTFSWCDSYIEIDNSLAKRPDWGNKTLCTDIIYNQSNPIYNNTLTYTLYSLNPTISDIRLLLKAKNTLLKDEIIGVIKFDIRDIIATISYNKKTNCTDYFWKNIYIDLDGQAPKFVGRIYLSIKLLYNIKDRIFQAIKLIKNPALQTVQAKIQPYKLEIELYEAIELLDNEEEYIIDVTMGHNLTRENRLENGMIWETFYTKKDQQNNSNKHTHQM